MGLKDGQPREGTTLAGSYLMVESCWTLFFLTEMLRGEFAAGLTLPKQFASTNAPPLTPIHDTLSVTT